MYESISNLNYFRVFLYNKPLLSSFNFKLGLSHFSFVFFSLTVLNGLWNKRNYRTSKRLCHFVCEGSSVPHYRGSQASELWVWFLIGRGDHGCCRPVALKSWKAKPEWKGGTRVDREEARWLFILTVLFSLPYSALVWGLSVKHNPQKVGKDHTLEDEDVIQIVKKWSRLLSPSAGPTTAAFPRTKHPVPSPFWFWQPLDQDSGEGDGGTQTGTCLFFFSFSQVTFLFFHLS